MKKCVLLCLIVSSLCATSVQSAIYNLNHTLGSSQRKLRLNIPSSVEEVRGILIYGNGAGGDTTGRATDSELVAFAESQGFAVLATGYWGGFFAPDDSELLGFEAMLAGLAEMSGHPELVDAPWLPLGHSNGGQMSFGFAAKRPWKVIGFIISKGGYYTTYHPSTATLLVPGMLIAGEYDRDYRIEAARRLIHENRPRGALWAWVEEKGTGHEEANAQQLKLTFLAECVRLRYPADQSPVNGPVMLKDLHECNGWLVDHRTWRDSMTAIHPYADAPEDPRVYGWVPNEKIARYYQAFSSYEKATSSVTVSASSTTAPTTLTCRLRLISTSGGRRGRLSGPQATAVQFYHNGRFVEEVVPENGVDPSIQVEQAYGGMQAFTAIVSYDDDTQKATHLKRLFVRGQRPPTVYETWAQATLPDPNEGPDENLYEDGVTHIERQAFDLELTEYPDGYSPLQVVESDDYHVYTYDVNEAALDAGLNIMPQVSDDGEIWSNVVKIDDPDYSGAHYQVDRQGATITIKFPLAEAPPHIRITVSDTFEGI